MTTAMMDDVKRMYRLTWWALMLRGLLSLAVGVFIFARPLDSVAAFALVIAFWALFLGFVDIVHAFQLRGMMQHWWVLLLAGLVGVGFGIAALVYYPTLALTFAVVWAAWWLLVVTRRCRALIAVYRNCRHLRGAGALVVVNDQRPDAYTTPQPAGRIVVVRVPRLAAVRGRCRVVPGFGRAARGSSPDGADPPDPGPPRGGRPPDPRRSCLRRWGRPGLAARPGSA